MQALIVTRTGAMTPQAAKQRGLPVVLVQGGIHAGEIDGKDAGFLALREVLEQRAAPGALDRQVLLFVPVFKTRMVDFRGYAYARTPSDVSGILMTRYDESRPRARSNRTSA